jgi:hypothetical protein
LIREFFEREGEAAFRDVEQAVLHDVLSADSAALADQLAQPSSSFTVTHQVLSTGGWLGFARSQSRAFA